jgi:hypothetical protein
MQHQAVLLMWLVVAVVLAEQELTDHFLAFKVPPLSVALAEQDILGHILATHMAVAAADQYTLNTQHHH